MEGGLTPRNATVVSAKSSMHGSPPAGVMPSARQLGWAAFDTPEARRASAGKARVAVVVLSLQVVLFQLILSAVYPEDIGTSAAYGGFLGGPGTLFLGLALLYLALAVVAGLDVVAGEVFGYVLCVASILVWLLVLGGGPALYSPPPRSAWVVLVSIIDSVGIVVGLLVIRELVHEPQVRSAA